MDYTSGPKQAEEQTPVTGKYTKGPWKVEETGEWTISVVSPWSATNTPGSSDGYGDYRGTYICELAHQKGNPCVSKDCAEANARLIAKAPTMYETLERIASICTDEHCRALAKAAIGGDL